MDVTVYSVTGNILFHQSYETGSVVDVNTGLSKGFYVIKIETDGGIYTKKVLVK